MTGDPGSAHRRSDCPEPGLLAAHAEGRLEGQQARRVDAHLVDCEACYEVFSETVRFAIAEQADEEPVDAAPTPPGAPLLVRSAGLAAAAAVLLALPLSLVWRSAGRVEPHVSELAQALGPRRFVEPRLSGGFPYARFETLRAADAPSGLDDLSPEVLVAVARIREHARDEPSPEALGALAMTYLLAGDATAAVDALEDATAQSPDDPRLLSDLAAAYLARATQLDEPADVPLALEAAERAVAQGGAPDAAWFNRALALERLPLVEAARDAWRDYLVRDAKSGWAEEARQHLADLQERQSSVGPDASAVRDAVERGGSAVAALAAEAPERLRSHLEHVLLAEWAEAHLAGAPGAGRLRERILAIGEALMQTTGDPMPRDAGRALTEPSAAGSRAEALREQALGYRALREAEDLYDVQQPACALFEEAQRRLAAGGSPYVLAAQLQGVVNCVTLAPPQPALAALARLAPDAEFRGYKRASGRVAWLQGLVHARHGSLTASLERYGAALAVFRSIRDATGEAAMRAALAENDRHLGTPRSAWAGRQRALSLLLHVDSPRRRHAILDEALLGALDAGMIRTARHFGTALVETTSGWANPMASIAALTRRASILDELGAEASSAADIRSAREQLAGLPDDAWAERLRNQVDVVEGTILARRNPAAAVVPLERALASARVAAPLLLPALHLRLARAHAACGRDDEAETHLVAGIETMETKRISLRQATAQLTFFDRALPLFDDMVRLEVERRGRPERGLAFVERGHARQLVDALAGASAPSLDPPALRRALPEGVALVYHLPLEDRLYAWTLTREGTQFIERPLPAAELARLVAAHRTAIERRASPAVVHRTSARLHDELVHPFLSSLAGKRALVFVADGVLQQVPFAALRDAARGRWLVEDYAVGVAPSGTVFARASSRAAALRDPGALAVGNPRIDRALWKGLPPLPGAEAEAREVARLYRRSETLTGAGATPQAFLEGARRHEVVHFAGHALAPPGGAASPSLLLSPGSSAGDSGALTLRDLEGLALSRTQLVVLAACRTAAGPVSRVEGAQSLARPFLAAGVPDVVASLWDVDDALSRRFFVAFHRALLDLGRPEQALRAAQLGLVREGDAYFGHPASWAPFVCIGGFGPPPAPSSVSSSSSPSSSSSSPYARSSSFVHSFAKGESS